MRRCASRPLTVPDVSGCGIAPAHRSALDRLRELDPKSALRKVRALFPGKGRCIFEGFAATQVLHPSCPHWYLCFVGVHPRMHATGIGTELLRPVLQQAERDGTCCYLETPFPQTHAFYERLGLQIASKGHPFAGAPPLWTMTRNCIGTG
jgi:GNAT superfamily N-acetyltransferase